MYVPTRANVALCGGRHGIHDCAWKGLSQKFGTLDLNTPEQLD